VRNNDDAANMRSAADHALTQAGDFDPASVVHAEVAGTVFPGHGADLCIDTERGQGIGKAVRHLAEAVADTLTGSGVANGPCKGDGFFVVNSGMSPDEALDRLESPGTRSGTRTLVS
jgi:hypothetical protein